jgi:hypothetical protein
MKLIEKIAESVHTSWWNEKEEQGFHSPKNCPNAIDSYEHGSFDKFKEDLEKSLNKCCEEYLKELQ